MYMCVCACGVCVCEYGYFPTQDGECLQEVGRVMTAAIQYDEDKIKSLLTTLSYIPQLQA